MRLIDRFGLVGVDFENGIDTKGIENNMNTADELIKKVKNKELEYEQRKSHK